MNLRVRRGQRLALAAAFGYALQNLAMRAAGSEIDPFVVVFLAGLPTALTSAAATLADRARRVRLARLWGRSPSTRRLLGGMGLVGVLVYAIGNPLFVKALSTGGAVIGTPSGSTVVIWSALLAALLLGERLSRSAVVGAVLFLGGVCLLSWGQGRGVPAGPGWFWAIPLGAGAGLCWALGNVGLRYGFSEGLDAFAMMAIYGVPGLGLVLAVILGQGRLAAAVSTLAAGPEGSRYLVLMLLAGLLNLGAQIGLTLAYASETVARTSVISSSSVAIVAVLAWAFLGETLNPAMAAGILIACSGMVLVQVRPAAGTGAEYLPNGRKNSEPS